MQLGDSDFADALALLSHTHQQMQVKATSVEAVSAAVVTNIHKGYATSSKSSETEETEATDYSDDIIFPVMNVSYNDMTANGTSLPYLPTTTTTDEPNSTTWESATTVLQNTTDHSNDSTIAIETTETATTMGVTTKEMETTTVTTATDMITTVVPIPNVHKFSLKNGSSYCLLLQSDIKFQIFYHSQNKLVKSYEFTVSNATINDNESVCSDHYTKLSLTFIPYGQNEEHKWTLVLLFNVMEPNKTSNDATTVRSTYTLNSLILNYYMDKTLFPDALTPGKLCLLILILIFYYHLARIPVGSYYSCLIVPEITLTGNEKIFNSCKLFMKNLKVEAFMNNSVEAFIGNGKLYYPNLITSEITCLFSILNPSPLIFFLTETLCDSDVNVNNMVPIGVGIALIVCIVVAITVFIVFSKRNRRSYTTL
ncbi:unnamed protein product [Schistosoma mattheei]|uniref:Uncharacterized protein n=1 Tax=Schistosoma mattheei TaxID=31246 RepID=A0A183P6B5_9TREM|nr:unnamed protein product [Schistosoma mattheei]